jgi:ribulose 1,5-bisphosphate carboxylase large subunit-like protein
MAFLGSGGCLVFINVLFLLGFDCVRFLTAKYPIIVMAHPSFSGTHFHDRAHGMPPGVLLGKIFRLLGSDASIFPKSSQWERYRLPQYQEIIA